MNFGILLLMAIFANVDQQLLYCNSDFDARIDEWMLKQ